MPEVVLKRPSVQGFTIDGATSRDLDDAIWGESLPGGGYRLTIAIADVAEVVLRDTALDQDARSRVETRYLRTGNDPMVPRRFSEGSLSLLPGEERAVIAIEVDLDRAGTPVGLGVKEAVLTSCERFTYEGVGAALKGPGHPGDTAHPLREVLGICEQAAWLLLRNRQASGACAFVDLAKGLYSDEDGAIRSLNGHASAQIIVQEFMILANRQVATWMAEAGRGFLFRNHEARAAAPERGELLRLMQEAAFHPHLLAGFQERLPLWLGRATYGPALLGHYALNVPAYTHITSPIRRYADLVNHRCIKALLHGKPAPYGREELEGVGKLINAWKEAQAEAKAAHLKSVAIHERRMALHSSLALLESMDGPGFSRTLEQAAKDDNPHPDLIQVLGRRPLVPVDYFHVFFRGGDGWLQARREALVRLREKPHEALMVLGIAAQKDKLVGAIRVGEAPGGFQARQKVTLDGQEMAPNVASRGATKKSAQAQAALAWLEGWVEGTLEEAKEMGVLDSVVDAGAGEPQRKGMALEPGERNGVGLLMEWCQKRRLPAPVFEYKAEGPPHQPRFRAQATLVLGAEVITVEGATKATKQDAKQAAALSLLAKVENRGN